LLDRGSEEIVIKVLNGVLSMAEIFRIFKSKHGEVQAELFIRSLIPTRHGVMAKISLVNMGGKPFSVLAMFASKHGVRVDAAQITGCEDQGYDSDGRCISIDLCCDAARENIDLGFIHNVVDFKPFSLSAFIQPNQAESGWVYFPLFKDGDVIESLGLVASGAREVIYAQG